MIKCFNEIWLSAIGDRWLVPEEIEGFYDDQMRGKECLVLPRALIDALHIFFKDKVRVLGKDRERAGYMKLDANPKQAYLLKEVLNFFEAVGNLPLSDAAVREAIKDTTKAAFAETNLKAFDLGRSAVTG